MRWSGCTALAIAVLRAACSVMYLACDNVGNVAAVSSNMCHLKLHPLGSLTTCEYIRTNASIASVPLLDHFAINARGMIYAYDNVVLLKSGFGRNEAINDKRHCLMQEMGKKQQLNVRCGSGRGYGGSMRVETSRLRVRQRWRAIILGALRTACRTA